MNQPGHSVCSEIQPAQLMSIHLTEDSDISILDDTTVEYFRVDVGGFIMGWANGQLDSDSITQYDSSGRMSINPVKQSFLTKNRRDWPEFSFVHKTGSGSAKWCLEPFITALLHPQGCFVARPNTTTVHEGCALGNVCNVSIDLGFNCLRSASVNTSIMHRSTQVLYPLALEVASNG